MPDTPNNSGPRQPATDATARKATPATSSTTAAPGPRHVRIHRGEAARGAGTERIIGRPPGVA